MRINRNSYELALGRSGMSAMRAREIVSKNGVSESSFTRAIRGENVRPGTVMAIATALGIDIAELIEEE